jgi:16S rRNA (cytidine1402-2'-O)-methyltransferase
MSKGQPGTLYVVATPIGNLGDLTERAARVLGEVGLIAAENSQTASKLLKHIGVRTSVVPYNDRNKGRTTARLLSSLADGLDVAVISDAGTPGISDPGQDLVEAAREAGVVVVPVPGASAVATLLSAAGAWGRTYRMIGFLPRKAGERRAVLERIREVGEPTVVFESPHRIEKTLAEIDAVLPNSRLVVGRELTKLYEEIWLGRPAEAVEHFASPRGEFAMLVIPPDTGEERWGDAAVIEALGGERETGLSHRDAATAVAGESGRPRREVYALWSQLGTAAGENADGQ